MNPASPERWAGAWRQVSASDDPQPVYQELLSRYSEAHRHYHNLRHIADSLVELDAARHLAKDRVALELAIWFHDSIYDTHASDNEEKSAKLARQRIGEAGGGSEPSESVAALVLATKTHQPTSHPDAPLLIDVDLSILGQNEERFQLYEAQIRREYDWVPAKTFAAKRAEILEGFLARKRIYATELFLSKYEQAARSNLEGSIRKLKELEI